MQVYPTVEDDEWIREDDPEYVYDVLFLNLLWKQWEPSSGKFDTAFLDQQLDKAHQGGKDRQLALRFQVMDKGCLDEVPTWMVAAWRREANRSASTCPREECRTSWSLKWELDAVQERHAAALSALGKWVDDRPGSIAWVELGSYGFWGGVAPLRMRRSRICGD